MANQNTSIAQKYGVTAYPHNTFNKAEAIAVLQQMISPLQSIIGNGGGTDSQKATHAYLAAVLNDITKYSIASENALLTSAKMSGRTASRNPARISFRNERG
jgi:hypothetical protein